MIGVLFYFSALWVAGWARYPSSPGNYYSPNRALAGFTLPNSRLFLELEMGLRRLKAIPSFTLCEGGSEPTRSCLGPVSATTRS
jgi:hypothetical protein